MFTYYNNGNLFSADGLSLIRYAIGKTETSYTIPTGVTKICADAFGDSNLVSIVIPNTVTTIERNAFSLCGKLTSVSIPSGVTEIADFTFYQCHQLSSINLPNSIIKIGQNAFDYCNISSLVLPSSLKTMDTYAFSRNYHLVNITIPASVTEIGYGVFNDCWNLKTVTFASGSNLKVIGDLAFSGTSIEEITIPYSVTKIGERAFAPSTQHVFYVDNDGKYSLIGYAGTASELILPEKINGHEYTLYQYASIIATSY